MLLSEKTYWFALSVAFTVLALLIWLWFIPYGILEYNLAVNLFTSSIFMVLTVVLLSWLLDLREKQEWKNVKTAVFSILSTELSLLFQELLNFVEDGPKFSLSLALTKREAKQERKDLIVEKLSKLQKKESVKFNNFYISHFLKDKNTLKTFMEIKKNLGDAQIRYSKHLSPDITISLMKIHDLLELLRLSHEMDNLFGNMKPSISELSELISKLTPTDTIPKIPKIKETSLEETAPSLIQVQIIASFRELVTLWGLGLEFDYP